jgi:hypothetical protein
VIFTGFLATTGCCTLFVAGLAVEFCVDTCFAFTVGFDMAFGFTIVFCFIPTGSVTTDCENANAEQAERIAAKVNFFIFYYLKVERTALKVMSFRFSYKTGLSSIFDQREPASRFECLHIFDHHC